MRFLTLVIPLVLGGCEAPPYPTQKTFDGKNIINSITDFGSVDGCSLKWVDTSKHTSFWLVRCPAARNVTTYYTTSSKDHTSGMATTEER